VDVGVEQENEQGERWLAGHAGGLATALLFLAPSERRCRARLMACCLCAPTEYLLLEFSLSQPAAAR